MRDDRTEILVRADKFQIFDDLIPQLCNLDPDGALFQGSHQSTQYHSRGDIDGRHAGKIEHDGPDLRRGRVDHNEDLPADVLRIVVKPCARAAHDKGTRRIARIRVSSATDEVSGGPV